MYYIGIDLGTSALTQRYEQRYQQFKKIYPACRELFSQLV